MSVRLRVIGSSPAWPNPGSAQSGYLVEGAGTLLLDCGPGVLGRLRESGELDVDAIAVTHFHLDHWGDLVPWAWLVAFGEERGRHAELWLPPGGIAQLATFASLWGNEKMFEKAFELEEYTPGEPFEAAGYELEARQVPHYGLEAFGFRIRDRSSGALLAYSGSSRPGPICSFARRRSPTGRSTGPCADTSRRTRRSRRATGRSCSRTGRPSCRRPTGFRSPGTVWSSRSSRAARPRA